MIKSNRTDIFSDSQFSLEKKPFQYIKKIPFSTRHTCTHSSKKSYDFVLRNRLNIQIHPHSQRRVRILRFDIFPLRSVRCTRGMVPIYRNTHNVGVDATCSQQNSLSLSLPPRTYIHIQCHCPLANVWECTSKALLSYCPLRRHYTVLLLLLRPPPFRHNSTHSIQASFSPSPSDIMFRCENLLRRLL